MVRVLFPPVVVLSLLIRSPLFELSVLAARFGFPTIVDLGLVLFGLRYGLGGRLGIVAPIIVVVPTPGG